MKNFNILETTLRDGSYAINFSFTASDTSVLCQELESAGFRYIEIGHGVGMNASNSGYGMSANTDEEYMIAAKNALKKSKYGMFCIPEIARLEDIDLAANHDMGFIRIGTNVTEIEKSKEYIKLARDYGIFVTANFMKSYALPPEKFAQKVLLSEKYGSDLVYIVDSAGGMFSSDIKNYFSEIRKKTEIPLGFHGHDNLGMAVSNSLESIEMGFHFVDSSLQGLGRSSGNAATELLIAALEKKNYNTNIDLLKVLDIGNNYIQPILPSKGRMHLDVISGYADFHSSYMHYIYEYSAKYSVDPMELIIELTKIDKVSIDEEKLDEIARNIKPKDNLFLSKYQFDRYFDGEQDENKPKKSNKKNIF